MTEKKVEKGLEMCVKNDCTGCPYREFDGGYCCVTKLMEDVFELHKSQQAEIERLQTENNQFADIGKMYSEIRTEAIKEFAERLKEKAPIIEGLYFKTVKPISCATIDNLVKEMVGEDE